MVTVARAPVAALPNVSMSQSGLMVAALIGGFIVYLAMQGKLGTYWTLMTGGGALVMAGLALNVFGDWALRRRLPAFR